MSSKSTVHLSIQVLQQTLTDRTFPIYHHIDMAVAMSTPCREADMIDGISNQVSSIVISGSAYHSFIRTPETEGTDGISWLLKHTPKAAVQSDKDYLSQEMSSDQAPRLKFPNLNGRQVRKWKLKVRSSCNISDPKPRILPTNRAQPATPQGCSLLAAENPPMIPRKITVIHRLHPPKLNDVEAPGLVYEDLNSALKPRPTVLFVSPQKKRRIS